MSASSKTFMMSSPTKISCPGCFRLGFRNGNDLQHHIQVCTGSGKWLPSPKSTHHLYSERKDHLYAGPHGDMFLSDKNNSGHSDDPDDGLDWGVEDLSELHDENGDWGTADFTDLPAEPCESPAILESKSTNSTNISPYARVTPPTKSGPPFSQKIGLNPAFQFQVDLGNILLDHGTDLSLYDDLVTLLKRYADGRKLKFNSDLLSRRDGLIKNIEKFAKTENMRPLDHAVRFKDGSVASVPVFNIEAMILSLLHNPELMRPGNLARNYGVFSGKPIVVDDDDVYGEIHTGDKWDPARRYHCGTCSDNMPVGLIVFGDKSHLDHHGALSATPVIFTLSCFNETARASPEFWRPLSYIPNLGYGKTTSEKSTRGVSEDNLQREHDCLHRVFADLRDIYKRGGIATEVMGKSVVCKVWIHY